jgi:hypothetical protein
MVTRADSDRNDRGNLVEICSNIDVGSRPRFFNVSGERGLICT